MSHEESNIRDRWKKNKLWHSIPDAKDYESKQTNYSVTPEIDEELCTKATRIFGVRPPKLKEMKG